MDLITLAFPNSAGAESWRTLRTNLHFAALERALKTLVIASPADAALSAQAVANLAVVSAQGEKRVIALDVNLRSPQLHTQFGLQNSTGLAEALQGAALTLLDTSVPGLRVLTAGLAPIIASDAVGSARMASLIESLKEQADLILINCAPAAEFSDAALLAASADAALLVVAADKTRRADVEKARDAFTRARARLLGAVLLR